jgi:hypothetical protein
MRELQAWQGDGHQATDATADALATRTDSSPKHEVLREPASRIAKHFEYCKVVEATEAKYAAEQGRSERSRLPGAETVAEDAVRPTGARGIASGREFDPEAAGGPIRRLDASAADITNEGVRVVAAQLGYGPESGTDLGSSEMYDVWNNVHTASLEDYGVSGADLFYPGLAP